MAGDRALYNLFFVWAMNKGAYDALPEDLQAVIDANSGAMAAAWAGRAHDTGDAVGRDVMDEAGNELATLSPEESARIRALGEEVRAEWIADMDDRGYDGAALVAAAEAAVAEHSE